ncbi:MAG: ABC transporter permease [Pseudomarimonas sp.]
MHIRPIFSALLRNKVGLILIGLQMALTLAVVVNALYIIQQRLALMNESSGIDEPNIFSVTSSGFVADFDAGSVVRDDLRRIRETPGVVAAFASNTMPLTNGGWASGLENHESEPAVTATTAMYFADEQAVKTYGVNLIAGRNFTAEEIGDFLPESENIPTQIIITEGLARALFPDVEAVSDMVGRRIITGDPDRHPPAEIIGIVERLRSPWRGWADIEERVTLVPYRKLDTGNVMYIVRTEPGQRDRLMGEIENMLIESNSGRIIRGLRSFSEVRENFYRNDGAVSILLGIVVAALLLVTGLGIVGLVSFWVTQRIKQIGTRRALGASKPNILGYFMTENLIIACIGAVSGSALAYLLNALLMSEFGLSRLAWYWVPVGALIILILGQIAAFGPARRASRVSPAIATRTV